MNLVNGRWYLDEQDAREYGLDIRASLLNDQIANPETVLRSIFRTVTSQVYGYIHKYSIYTALQDRILAECPSAKDMIKEALLTQLEYITVVGNLAYSVDKDERDARLSPDLLPIFERTIMETGRSILYSGV